MSRTIPGRGAGSRHPNAAPACLSVAPHRAGTGAQFYPIFTTRIAKGTCTWQEGGTFILGTKDTFGGTSTAEFGPLLQTVYPAARPTTVTRYNNFNSGDLANPCRTR